MATTINVRIKKHNLIVMLILVFTGPTCVFAQASIDSIASRLIDAQQSNGSWSGQDDYMGPIVAGLINAYQVADVNTYKDSAENGGNYIIYMVNGGNYYGDEAYALSRLSQMSSNPANNDWRTEITNYYNCIVNNYGTSDFINDGYAYGGTGDDSIEAYYIANHTVAAYYADNADKEIWRNSLINELAQIDTEDFYPVMGLGISVWALAQTGPMDNTLVSPSAETCFWYGITLADLPALLLDYQKEDGSFYWRFDKDKGTNTADYNSGYTEDTVFGVLGLIAADNADPNLNLDSAILASQRVLLSNTGANGEVYEHLFDGSCTYDVYAGELLQAINKIAGDLNNNGIVDYDDLLILTSQWLQSPNDPSHDIGPQDNPDGIINFLDFSVIAKNWHPN